MSSAERELLNYVERKALEELGWSLEGRQNPADCRRNLEVETGGGEMVIYDDDNLDAWLKADHYVEWGGNDVR